MEYVFAIFMFGMMISLLVLKGIVQARDFANEALKKQESSAGTNDAGGQRFDESTR
jgi:hypothetical protein